MMGLDTTHDAWHGAYSAFGRWRNQIAEALGWEIVPAGYGLTYMVPESLPEITPATVDGQWDEEPSDPICYLMHHSDCDGELAPERCAKLADRLEEILPKLPTDGAGHLPNPQAATRRFIEGCRRAARAGETLEFG